PEIIRRGRSRRAPRLLLRSRADLPRLRTAGTRVHVRGTILRAGARSPRRQAARREGRPRRKDRDRRLRPAPERRVSQRPRAGPEARLRHGRRRPRGRRRAAGRPPRPRPSAPRCQALPGERISSPPGRSAILGASFSLRTVMAASNGTIKRLVSDKGFGFILADDGNEYFFHNSACQGTRFDHLREGQAGTLEKGQGPRGPRAESVRVA